MWIKGLVFGWLNWYPVPYVQVSWMGEIHWILLGLRVKEKHSIAYVYCGIWIIMILMMMIIMIMDCDLWPGYFQFTYEVSQNSIYKHYLLGGEKNELSVCKIRMVLVSYPSLPLFSELFQDLSQLQETWLAEGKGGKVSLLKKKKERKEKQLWRKRGGGGGKKKSWTCCLNVQPN